MTYIVTLANLHVPVTIEHGDAEAGRGWYEGGRQFRLTVEQEAEALRVARGEWEWRAERLQMEGV